MKYWFKYEDVVYDINEDLHKKVMSGKGKVLLDINNEESRIYLRKKFNVTDDFYGSSGKTILSIKPTESNSCYYFGNPNVDKLPFISVEDIITPVPTLRKISFEVNLREWLYLYFYNSWLGKQIRKRLNN